MKRVIKLSGATVRLFAPYAPQCTREEPAMTRHATITDHFTYTPGDGAPLVIPQGPVEVDLTPDSATLSWTAENGAAGLTAIPLTQYKEYVRQKRITLAN